MGESTRAPAPRRLALGDALGHVLRGMRERAGLTLRQAQSEAPGWQCLQALGIVESGLCEDLPVGAVARLAEIYGVRAWAVLEAAEIFQAAFEHGALLVLRPDPEAAAREAVDGILAAQEMFFRAGGRRR